MGQWVRKNARGGMKKLLLKNPVYQQLEQAYKSWLQALGYSENSVYGLPLHVREFLHYQEEHGHDYQDWKSGHFLNFMTYVKMRKNQRRSGALSSNHINKMAQSLDLLQRYLIKLDQLDFYYKIDRLKSEVKKIRIFSHEEIENLYESCSEDAYGIRMKALLGLCYGCGLRKSEAINLDLSDIWWEKGLLQVQKSKTKTSRLVPVTSSVLNDLKDYANRVRPLFGVAAKCTGFLVSNRKQRLGKQAAYQSFVNLLKAADLPQTGFHTLRHSIASHLTESGMASEQIAEFLGHKTLDSTQIYVHFKKQ